MAFSCFERRRGSFLSLLQVGCATVVVRLPCFRTCLFSGLQRFVMLAAIFSFFFCFLGSVGNVSRVFCLRFRSVLGRFGLGFRWCLAVSGRLPTSFIFVFVPARLRDGCCFRTCLSSGL